MGWNVGPMKIHVSTSVNASLTFVSVSNNPGNSPSPWSTNVVYLKQCTAKCQRAKEFLFEEKQFLTFSSQETEGTSVPEGSLAESLRAAAEAAVSQTGFIYDENTGLYYDHSTGFYYNSVRVVLGILGIFPLLQKLNQ